MATNPPGHSVLNDRQSRISLSMIDDRTNLAASTTTTSTMVAVSRLETDDAANSTKTDTVVEIGTNGLVGGVVHLGSFKGTMARQATSTKLLGLLTAQKQNPTVGATTNWNYYNLASAEFDYCRLLADSLGNVYGARIGLGTVLTNAKYEGKNAGNTMETFGVLGKHLVYINGYPISKNYVAQAADVTAASLPISSTWFGALNTATSGAEIPKKVAAPTTGQSPSALYASGRINFLTLYRILSANAVIGGINYFTGNFVRYTENQDYQITAASLGTIGAQAAVTTTVNGVNYLGAEITVGSSIVVDVGGANQENCNVTAVGTNTISFTTTKIHATTGITVGLTPASGQVLYNALTGKLICGDTLVAGDTWRSLFASNDTNGSVPKTISTTTMDTQDVAGIPGRLTPVSIAALGIPRVQDASIDVAIARKEVQGIGEAEVRFGTAGVPAISYSASAIATDNQLLAQLSTGSTADGIYAPDYISRYQNTNAQAFVLQVKSPIQNQKVLFSIQGNQPVLNYDESGAASAEITVKLSGVDVSGAITISATS